MRCTNTIYAIFISIIISFLSCQKTPGSKALEAETVNNKISWVEPSHPNIYAELLDSIEAKYQFVLILKDKPLQHDSTAEKLKAIGFYSNANLYEDQNDAVLQARSNFKIIEHYRDKYQYLPFIYNDREGRIYSEYGWIEVYGEILYPISKKYDMRIFNASSFTGIIPDSIAQKLLNFKYSSIRKDDLREILCPLDEFDRDKTPGKIYLISRAYIRKTIKKEHDTNPYHDFDIQFRILAPSSEGSKISDRIVLFPVKHGYLIVAQWGFEQDPRKLAQETDSTSARTITLPKFDYILNQVPRDNEVSYDFNGTLYWVDQYIVHYVDSLKRDFAKTKSQEKPNND